MALGGRDRQALGKGHTAERQIGRALEQAITAKNCAIAHNVVGVMDSGDIDHIVATPKGVWVVETKYRRVPSERLPKVLSRLHACRARVEAILPAQTPVAACLVLAYDEGGVKPERDGIRVYNNATFPEFLNCLRAERQQDTVVPNVSNEVWKLSRAETPVSSDAVPQHEPDAADSRTDEPAPTRADEAPFPNAGGPWSSVADQELVRLYRTGRGSAELAQHFGRTPGAIDSRLRKLGYD